MEGENKSRPHRSWQSLGNMSASSGHHQFTGKTGFKPLILKQDQRIRLGFLAAGERGETRYKCTSSIVSFAGIFPASGQSSSVGKQDMYQRLDIQAG